MDESIFTLTELLDLDPDRVDFVAKPATRRRFLLFKASISQRPWNFPKSAYTIEQLLRAVPAAIRAWARGKANGDVTKDNLKLRYREPGGAINIRGIRAALQRLPQTRGIPGNVLAAARKELQAALSRANKQLGKSEDLGGIMEKRIEDLQEVIKKINDAKDDKEKLALKKEAEDLMTDLTAAVEAEDSKITKDEVNALAAALLKAADEEDEKILKDTLSGLIETVKALLSKETKAEDDKTGDEDGDEDDDADDDKDLNKSELAPELQKELDKYRAVEAARIAKASAGEKQALLDRIAKAEKEATTAKERIEKMQKDALHREWVIKAEKDFDKIPLKPETLADLFMEVGKAETVEKVEALLASCNEIIKTGKFFEEVGTVNPAPDSPEGKIEALVKSEMAKSDNKLTIEQARGKVLEANKDLLATSDHEHRGK